MIDKSCPIQRDNVDPPANNTLGRRPDLAMLHRSSRACFDIYCSEVVRLTSTLFGGGDWHWRLTSASGDILADCGGYRNHRDCLAVVDSLRALAGSAIVPGPYPPSRSWSPLCHL